MAARNDPLANVLVSRKGGYEHPFYCHAMYLGAAMHASDVRRFLVDEHPEVRAADMGVDCLRVLYRALLSLPLDDAEDDEFDGRLRRLLAALKRLKLTRAYGGEKLLKDLYNAITTSTAGDYYAKEILRKNASRAAEAAARH